MKSIILTIFALICEINGAKILGIFPGPSPSHYFIGRALMRGLAKKGHDVTVISSFGEKKLPRNGSYRDIILTGRKETKLETLGADNMFKIEGSNQYINSFFTVRMMLEHSANVLAHKNVQKLIHSNESFDVVIVEQYVNDAHKAFSVHFKAPLISVCTMGANFWTNPLVGNPSPPSYVSDAFLHFKIPMSFSARLQNGIFTLYNYILYYLFVFPRSNEIIKKYFPNGPELEEVLYNSSILLLNSHPSTNRPVPYVPNMVDIGGIHIEPPKKLLRALQEFLDGAPDGVIYFSMGSNLKSTDLPSPQRNVLISVFSKLKQKILWKWENGSIPNLPANLKLNKWLPQQDILAHPNVKLFITHGGLLSTTEAIYHGVPILAIPIFADQKLNAQAAEDSGFGLKLAFSKLTEDELYEKIQQLLNNPKYKNNAMQRSKIFHDRPVKPMDLATYWVEYVIRHRGAAHLRVGGLDLPWYQYHLLDVISLLAIICLIFLTIILWVFKKIFGTKKLKKVKGH